jgi:hypothetical protein
MRICVLFDKKYFIEKRKVTYYTMWNLDLSQITSNNCYDSMIYSILNHQNYDSRIANLSCFSSVYYDKDSNQLFRKSQINKFLEDVLNIKIVFSDQNIVEYDVINQINNNLSYAPIGVYSDPYDCNWAPGYQKLHFKHFFLIVENIKNKKQYLCADIYFKDIGYFKLGYEDLLNIYDSIVTFRFPNNCLLDKNKLYCYLINNFIIPDSFSQNEQKKQLIQLFTQRLTPEDIIGEDINQSIILLNLDWIAEDKRNFTIGLQLFDEYTQSDLFKTLSPALQNLRDDFILLKSLMIKYALTNTKKIERILGIIDQIFDLDMKVIKTMQYALKNI